MSGSRILVAAVVVFTSFFVLAQFAGRWTEDQVTQLEPLIVTNGRVQLVIDEQDVGPVPQGMPLEVEFTIANTGDEQLSLRQAPHQGCTTESAVPLFTIEPGHTGKVLARLSADDLLDRGRKHILFFTSDATNPELWLTIRGSVLRRTIFDYDNESIEHSVLVK